MKTPTPGPIAQMQENPIAQHLLDTTGLKCPEPVMLLHKAVREMESGEIIAVVATDPSTERDIPRFCQFLGHALLKFERSVDVYRYFIKKK